MMYNTGNPVGSTAPKDLYDNAQVLDKLVVGTDPMVVDRLGVQRYSWAGMEYDFQNAQEGRDQAFQDFLAASAFVFIGDYGAGLNFTNRNQYMIRDGIPYRVASGTTLPYTTTGNWAVEVANFTPISSDDILRQDLNNAALPTMGISLVGRAVVSVPSMYALCQLGAYRSDAVYKLASWHVPTVSTKFRGGGDFVYMPLVPKSSHNGGYIISPTVPITNGFASTPDFLAGTGETDPGGSGCLVRVTEGDVYAESFGLLDESTYVWNCKSFNAAIKWADPVSPDVSPGMVRFLDGEFKTTDPVILYRPNGVTGRLPGFRGQGAYKSFIIKTTNNTAGPAFPWRDFDAAVIEIPPQDPAQYLAGADSGGFTVQKLGEPRTGYGYYAQRSYFGKRTDIFTRGFNYGFATPECWMSEVRKVWAFGNNIGFMFSGTSNWGGNLYSSGSRELGFDFSGLTYSNLTTACDGTGEQGTTPKVGYKLSGSHGLKLHAGAEKNVGKDFEITNTQAFEISGHCFSTGVSTVIANKITVTGSTGKWNYDWSLALSNLTAPQKAFYPNLFTKDVQSAIDWGMSNFGETDPRMPQVLDGKFATHLTTSGYSNINGNITLTQLLSSSVFKQAVYVGSSPRIKLIWGVCTDTTSDTSFEPTVPLGHAVSAISTDSGAPTEIGNLYIGGTLNVGRLVGYVSNGWLYLRGPSGQQRTHTFHFLTAPLA